MPSMVEYGNCPWSPRCPCERSLTELSVPPRVNYGNNVGPTFESAIEIL